MSLRLRPLCLAILASVALAGPAAAADLVNAYELARQGDPVLAGADAQRNATGEGVNQARAALLPFVTGTGTYGRSDSESEGSQVFGGSPLPPSSSESESSSRSWNISLQQSLYDHANYTRLQSSRLRAGAADHDYAAAEQELVVRVAEAYFNVLTSIETLASARAEERAVRRQLDQAERRLEVGLAPITDVYEARASYDSARARAIASANALEDAREALTEITGEPIEGLRGLSLDYQPTLPTPAEQDAWVNSALELNPSLLSAKLAAEAAEADIRTARAAHLPTLGASISRGDSGSWGDSTNRLTGVDSNFDNSGTDTRVGVTLTVPIFAGGATQSGVRQAIYSRDAAAERFEQQRRAVARSTRTAHRAVIAGIAEIEARRQAVISARSAYESTEAGLEVGTRTIVDVLLSQQQLFAAQREFANARHVFLVNGLRLKAAAGSVTFEDLQAVNALLSTDADALLEQAEGDQPMVPSASGALEPAPRGG